MSIRRSPDKSNRRSEVMGGFPQRGAGFWASRAECFSGSVRAAHTRGIDVFLNLAWALPLALVLRLVWWGRPRRFGPLRSGRIGHFVLDGAEQCVRMRADPDYRPSFWVGGVANKQWERMLRRYLCIRPWAKGLYYANRILPGGQSWTSQSSWTNSRDVDGLLAFGQGILPFLPEETAEAHAWMSAHGLDPESRWVCLLSRDSAYLQTQYGLDTDDSYGHEYRNTRIADFLPTIKWLLSAGWTVFRMGSVAAEPVGLEHPNFIDYPFIADRSDLMDIWLFANCAACISVGTGPDAVSLVYDRPILMINALPLGSAWSFARCVWVPKRIKSRKDGHYLGIEEMLHHTYLADEDFDKAGLDVVGLGERQILAEVQDFMARRVDSGLPRLTEQEIENRHKLRAWPRYAEHHGWMHPEFALRLPPPPSA